jgi:hypothetical protein
MSQRGRNMEHGTTFWACLGVGGAGVGEHSMWGDHIGKSIFYEKS